VNVHLLDIEWLLSTLFDASLLKLRAAGNGGSFFCPTCQRKAGVAPFPFCPALLFVVRPAGNYVCSFAVRALDMMGLPAQWFWSRQGLA
jgi:hypothetical protein